MLHITDNFTVEPLIYKTRVGRVRYNHRLKLEATDQTSVFDKLGVGTQTDVFFHPLIM